MILKHFSTVFIHIPKCGGMSVEIAYRKKYNIRKMGNKTWIRGFAVESEWTNNNGETVGMHNMHATYDRYAVFYPYFKYIAQVRHPMSRWESVYKHFCKIDLVDTPFVDWTRRAQIFLPKGQWWKLLDNFDRYWSRTETVGSHLHTMFLPQWTWVRVPEVQIFTLESKKIWKHLGMKEERHNVSPSLDCPWTPDNKRFIHEFYDRDFREFKYDYS